MRWAARLLLAVLCGAFIVPAYAQDELPTCAQVLDCFGNTAVGDYPNCHCPTCQQDTVCTFPDLPDGTWPDCLCVRPPPVDPKAPFDACQAACPVGSGSGQWPDCVCEPSSACNPLACPFGTQMVGKPPFCQCELPQIQPPPG